MAPKVWFITGASRGFGRVWAEAALSRGDKVAATARSADSLTGLAKAYGSAVLPLELDVTDRAGVFAAVERAHAHFGRLDVVVNNAGYGLFGAIEETSEAEARAQIETNVFGALWVIQAVLPRLRQQGGGHILSVSSIGGIVAFPTLGLYHASKWALEALNESLTQEVAGQGIKVTLIEPGSYATDWAGSSSIHTTHLPEYDGIRSQLAAAFAGASLGDPKATGDAILKLVDADKPPLRLFLGSMPLPIARQRYAERLATWSEWETVSSAAQGSVKV
ncbi:SDR family oxidoreductase [Cupriavidus numazuensis]|uniref:2-(R)-hydroxypropyl-CoM dehydrogenase n=1 Tax=Cupriavidus numazuensis TaxID=221992 RepID=A0ABM8TLV7_9BURK|nr:SDR family oxidoreductase [Cupriavidus numazuensis]CAG2154140.1 2-(R)-hydroxypropyl-CoM dehydrogenase [Cupriavidus numazuensis]